MRHHRGEQGVYFALELAFGERPVAAPVIFELGSEYGPGQHGVLLEFYILM